MATLIPCVACRRHQRHSEAQCPFCRAQQPLTAPPARQITIPRDASRATIFALSLTLLGQACGEKPKDDADDCSRNPANCILTPPYGAISVGETGEPRDTCADNPLLAGCPPLPPCKPPLDCGISGESGGSSGLQDSAGSDGGTDRGSSGTAGDARSSDAGTIFDAGVKDGGTDSATNLTGD